MAKKVQKLRTRRGQGTTEYVIITALVAIAAIGVITLFGNNIRAIFGASATALTGANNVANTASTAQATQVNKNLQNFGQNNR